jgi:hypothetical protein
MTTKRNRKWYSIAVSKTISMVLMKLGKKKQKGHCALSKGIALKEIAAKIE